MICDARTIEVAREDPQLRCGYVGETKDGKQHGRGTYVYTNGDIYQGTWYEGRIHGRGIYTYANGTYYNGEFKNYIRHGEGTYCMLNGDIYSGQWIDGKRTGDGLMEYGGQGSGEYYKGTFRGNRRDGRGTYHYANSDIYDGYWVLDKKQGDGRITFSNGDTYEGLWWEDQMHGLGSFTWKATGTKYRGLYHKGIISGTFCPASPRDSSCYIIAKLCNYSQGQCTRCGQFNTPCPVNKTGEVLPCDLVGGVCSRCGKTDKLLGTLSPVPYALEAGSILHHKSQEKTPNNDIPLSPGDCENSHRMLPKDVVMSPVHALRPPLAPKLLEKDRNDNTESPTLKTIESVSDQVTSPGYSSIRSPAELAVSPIDNVADMVVGFNELESSNNNINVDIVELMKASNELLAGCRGGLGMAIADFPNGDEFHVKVVTVKSSSPAGKAGVRRNDRITGFCGRPINSKAMFLQVARDIQPGDVKQLILDRSGTPKLILVKAGANLSETDYRFLQQTASGDCTLADKPRIAAIRHAPGAIAW